MSVLKKHRNDMVLIVVLLLLAGVVWACMLLTRHDDGYVSVSIDSEEVMRLPLDEDVSIVLGEGEHTNTLVIENGQAYISQASCPDHVCIHQGKISYDGQTIVCLPNKLVVTAAGGAQADVDAVSQ